MTKRKQGWTPLQIATHVGAFIPLIVLAWEFWFGSPTSPLMINPFQEVTLHTGKTTLILLMLTLAVTPVNIVFGIKQVLPLRKPLGNYAFMYGVIHFLVFIVDNGFVESAIDFMAVYEATFEKRFAYAGFTALMIMLPLALTSNRWAMRQLRKNWKRLHRIVYAAGIAGVVHFIWLVKSDIREPLAYGALLILLLVIRVSAVRRYIINFRRGLTSRGRTVVGGA